MFNISVCDDSKFDIEKIKECLSAFSKKKHIDFNTLYSTLSADSNGGK